MSKLGITITVLATGLSEAVRKDELPEEGGFDLVLECSVLMYLTG